MLDIAHFFVGTASAQAAASPAASGGGSSLSSLTNFLPLLLIFAVFYVLIIRPQQKKLDEQTRMIKALKRGDRVVIGGGIHGKITRLDDDTLTVEIADGVNVKAVRAQVQGLAAKTDTTAIANDGGDDEKKS
jgi:preprotein translocase subunit YajC